ncbi:MAG TPA: hypothetical protein VEC18_07910 [Myxococcota bacterium]|nr:hypothetical protein [Myxococcota bacterium]
MQRAHALASPVALLALAIYVVVPVVHGSLAHERAHAEGDRPAYTEAPTDAQQASVDPVCPVCLVAGFKRTVAAQRAHRAPLRAAGDLRIGRARVEALPAPVELALGEPRAPPISS